MRFVSVTKKRLLATAAVALLCAPLAACSTGSSESSQTLTHAGAALDSASDGALPGALPGEALDTTSQRSIISNGDISIEVDDTRSALDEVTQLADSLGGYVEAQTLSGSSQEEATGASLTLRVPASKFDEAFEQIGDLGRVLHENRTAVDVTAQHVDLQARVASLETSVARLTDLMAGADTTSELLEAESALTVRQAELDSLRAQLKTLEGQVEEATIWVSLSTKSALPGGPSNFWEGLVAGVHSLAAAAAGALVVLGVLLPWLVIAAIVATVIVLIVRRGRRKQASATMTPPTTPTTPVE